MPEEDQISVWDLVDAWSETETDDKPKAELREQIRRTVLTRRGSLRGLSAEQKNRARQASGKLASADPIRRHAWLFAAAWVEYSADELDEGDLDIDEREKRIHELRTETMSTIWSALGLEGVLTLLADCDPWTVGRYAARCPNCQRAVVDALRTSLSIETDSSGKLDNFMQGFISFIDEDIRSTVVSSLAETATVGQNVRLLKCAPCREQTWRLLDGQDVHVRDRYWDEVLPAMARFTESETSEVIDRLLEAKRPRAALF